MKEAKSEVLLNECREFMTYRMRTSMSRMMGSLEETLFEMATGDCGTAQASHYIEAVREIRMKKREIQVRFENRFMSLFDESIRQIRKGQGGNKPFGAGTDHASNVISLEYAGKYEINSTVEKVRADCRSALSKLDDHIGLLLKTSEDIEFENPMEPGMVFDAFWESCRDLQAGSDIRRVLVQMFEKYVATDLHELYDDLNNLFTSYAAAGDVDDVFEEDSFSAIDRQVQTDSSGIGKRSVLVKNWVKDKVQLRIHESQMDIPGFVSDYLLQQWSQVLEMVYGKNGDSSLEWTRAIQVVDDLIMTTQPIADRDTRRRQLWMLPGLLYRLKNGMKTASIPLKQQAEFLSQLKAYHISLTEFSTIPAVSR